MQFYVETERLILRELLETDLEGIFELDSNPEVHKYLGNNPIKTMQQAEKSVQLIRDQYKNLGIGRFAAIEKTSGDFIGWSGLKLNTGEKEALNGVQEFIDVGYRFIPRYWGKGYATESAVALLDYGFKEKEYDTIYGAAETDNQASNYILQKIGLQFINDFLWEDKVPCKWYALPKEAYNL